MANAGFANMAGESDIDRTRPAQLHHRRVSIEDPLRLIKFQSSYFLEKVEGITVLLLIVRPNLLHQVTQPGQYSIFSCSPAQISGFINIFAIKINGFQLLK